PRRNGTSAHAPQASAQRARPTSTTSEKRSSQRSLPASTAIDGRPRHDRRYVRRNDTGGIRTIRVLKNPVPYRISVTTTQTVPYRIRTVSTVSFTAAPQYPSE